MDSLQEQGQERVVVEKSRGGVHGWGEAYSTPYILFTAASKAYNNRSPISIAGLSRKSSANLVCLELVISTGAKAARISCIIFLDILQAIEQKRSTVIAG
jgi:hypothetical protein